MPPQSQEAECAANPARLAAKQFCFAAQPVRVGCTSGFAQILSGPPGLLLGEHVSGHTAGGWRTSETGVSPDSFGGVTGYRPTTFP